MGSEMCIRDRSPALIKIQVSALSGFGNGDLDPQTTALNASSLTKGLSVLIRPEIAKSRTLS